MKVFRLPYFDPRDPAADPELTGHPAADPVPEPEPTPEPEPSQQQLVEVEVNGQKFLVTPEAKLAFEGYQAGVNLALNQRQSPAQPDPAPTPSEDDLDENLLFSDPKAYTAKLTEKIVKQVRADNQAEAGMTQFFNHFYTENKELSRADDHELVTSILNSRWNEFKDMPANKASTELGKAVRERLLAVAKRFGAGKAGEETVLEAGTHPTPIPETPAAPTTGQLPGSLTEIIRRRQAAREAARAKARA